MSSVASGISERPMPRVSAGWGLLFVLVFQLFVRYAAAPVTGLSLDDWNNWNRAEAFAGSWEATVQSLRNPARPATVCAIVLVHRLWGDSAAGFAALSAVGYTVSLLFIYLLVLSLTRSRWQALVAGMLFSVLPNLCDHFHWPCIAVSAGAYALPLYLCSAWAWVRYAGGGRKRMLALSVVTYGLGLFGYEIGAFLPAAFAVLLFRRPWRRLVGAMVPFAAMFAVYAAWRMTDAFGMGWTWYGRPPQFEAGISLYGLSVNVREILSWWFGGNIARAWLDGLNGFTLATPAMRVGLLIGNLALLAMGGILARKTARAEGASGGEGTVGGWREAGFALAFVATTYLPCFLSYTASRLNYLPAVGMVLLAVMGLARVPMSRRGGIVAGGILLLLSVAGQGTALNWRESARFTRQMYQTLEATKAEWVGKDVLWVDTARLSERLADNITTPEAHNIGTVSHFRNAGLLRGFVPSAMVERILAGGQGPQTILDVEYGARQEEEQLLWHARYDPSKPQQTPMSAVYRLDALQAGSAGALH